MPTVKACIIDSDGVVTYKPIESSLESFQSIVGGYLEGISGVDFFAYCNEEGKLRGLPVNMVATAVAGLTQDVLCGPVVFLGPLENDGEESDVLGTIVTSALSIGGKP